VPLHPTQYEPVPSSHTGSPPAHERRGRPFAGRTFWIYTLLYGISRFIIEFFRGDERGSLLGLSTSQFISVMLVALSVIMMIRLARRPPAVEESVPGGSHKVRERGRRR
jgi:phosphatidylglycerol:prolipoprotein diacylglycerol transferase